MAQQDGIRKDSLQDDTQDLPRYYRRSIAKGVDRDSFASLDEAPVLAQSMQSIASSVSRNFLLDFSDEEAWVAFDLSAKSIFELLKAPSRPDELNTRWINIWYPFHHKVLLEMIGRHYDFSPRLLAMMCSDPRTSKARESSPFVTRSRSTRSTAKTEGAVSLSDLEKGPEVPDAASIASNNPARTGNVYDIAEEVWHYSSVDQGRNYLCLGYNSIYNTGPVHIPTTVGHDSSITPLPHCKRVWTWLLLCSNRTIITINEDPFPFSEGRLQHLEDSVLRETRRNLLNVFRSLSHVEEPASTSPLSLLPIRQRLGNTTEETVHRPSDAPGLLFYYLFENWFNSYSLVTRRDSRYGRELENIRTEMFKQPQLHHIDRLDQVGAQLGVLKRHYQSYLRIIDRVVEPPTATLASLSNSQIMSKEDITSHGTETPAQIPVITESETLLGVSLSAAARVRFERLKDMIGLYALSEVKDYLAQKESLVQMNFQLIAIKESRDVERLTRVSLLITKATILFLPVSLMTAYFSVNLNVDYTIGTYWIGFGVVFLLSWIALAGFGVMSGSMQSMALYKPAKRMVMKLLGRKQD